MTGWRRLGPRRGMVLLLVLAAVGCSTPAVDRSPPPSFAGRGVMALDVATIEILDQYRPPGVAPNVDHLAPTPPVTAVHRWVAERLRAVGRSGSVQVIIKDASIREVQLPRTEGMKGWFTTDQSQRYDGRIQVKIVGQSPARRFTGYAQAEATRSTTVPEDISPDGREETWNTLVRQMMTDLDDRLERGIQDGLGPLLRR